MLTTLLVSAGTKVLGGFGLSKKSSTTTPTPEVAPIAGMTMRSGTVMEKKLTNEDVDSIEMLDDG